MKNHQRICVFYNWIPEELEHKRSIIDQNFGMCAKMFLSQQNKIFLYFQIFFAVPFFPGTTKFFIKVLATKLLEQRDQHRVLKIKL